MLLLSVFLINISGCVFYEGLANPGQVWAASSRFFIVSVI